MKKLLTLLLTISLSLTLISCNDSKKTTPKSTNEVSSNLESDNTNSSDNSNTNDKTNLSAEEAALKSKFEKILDEAKSEEAEKNKKAPPSSESGDLSQSNFGKPITNPARDRIISNFTTSCFLLYNYYLSNNIPFTSQLDTYPNTRAYLIMGSSYDISEYKKYNNVESFYFLLQESNSEISIDCTQTINMSTDINLNNHNIGEMIKAFTGTELDLSNFNDEINASNKSTTTIYDSVKYSKILTAGDYKVSIILSDNNKLIIDIVANYVI